MAEAPVLLGLGANLDAPLRQLVEAVQRLRPLIEPLAVSSVYRSAPVGYVAQPDFLNVVVRGRAGHAPETLLDRVLEIEQQLGRTRPFPNAPRTIDIDILAYGDLILDTPELTLPHPRLHHRAFVLVPLAEIAPEWRHPIFGKTAAELLAESGSLERVERVRGRIPM